MNKNVSQSKCTICGKGYNNIAFMGGYICDECIGHISSGKI
ncbi:hypothetical protein [Aminipila sp.]|nr:hypothetical protein [Aminipila sp.]